MPPELRGALMQYEDSMYRDIIAQLRLDEIPVSRGMMLEEYIASRIRQPRALNQDHPASRHEVPG